MADDFENLIRKIGDLAHYYELVYHGCSQAVLKALQDSLRIGDNLTYKAASAFAAGIARMGEICGALIGGIMAISLAYGRDKLDLKKEEDRQEFIKAGGHGPEGCPKVVKKAAMLAAEIILKEK